MCGFFLHFKRFLFATIALSSATANAQVIDDQTGGWYMYFWSLSEESPKDRGKGTFGLQGDIQYRNWAIAGDLEQLLLRGGVTYKPQKTNVKLTLGYAHITSGDFGESDHTLSENRAYQEALVPHRISTRCSITHRYRYEQRFTNAEATRTRFRYALFMNISLNRDNLKRGALYLALYNEIFINGERNVGGGKSVLFFDRNRAYAGLGYSLKDHLRIQTGYMQQTTNTWNKGQLQLSLHQSW